MHKWISVGFTLFYTVAAHSQNCTDAANRIVEGAQPTASNLYEIAKRTEEFGAWIDNDFYEERFTYLGELSGAAGVVHVTFFDTIWGPSCRSTKRLVFWDAKFRPIGKYMYIEEPRLVGVNTLSIPYEREPETVWVYKGELPECLDVADDCFPLHANKDL